MCHSSSSSAVCTSDSLTAPTVYFNTAMAKEQEKAENNALYWSEMSQVVDILYFKMPIINSLI